MHYGGHWIRNKAYCRVAVGRIKANIQPGYNQAYIYVISFEWNPIYLFVQIYISTRIAIEIKSHRILVGNGCCQSVAWRVLSTSFIFIFKNRNLPIRAKCTCTQTTTPWDPSRQARFQRWKSEKRSKRSISFLFSFHHSFFFCLFVLLLTVARFYSKSFAVFIAL